MSLVENPNKSLFRYAFNFILQVVYLVQMLAGLCLEK